MPSSPAPKMQTNTIELTPMDLNGPYYSRGLGLREKTPAARSLSPFADLFRSSGLHGDRERLCVGELD
jgi:hypothetical protein